MGRDSSGTGWKKQGRMGTGHRPVSPCARLVDGPGTLVGRSTVPGAVPQRDSLHRCVDQRLGCGIPGIDVEWDVAGTRSSHKLVGATGAPGCTTVTPVPSQGEDSSVYYRQFDHSLVSEQTGGGGEVTSAPQVVNESIEVSPCNTADHSPETHRGSLERLGGPGLKDGTGDTFGVVPLTMHVPVGDQSVSLGTTTVDMFANSQNNRLSEYISPCPDSQAIAVDALNYQWPLKVMYAFPPTCVLERFLLRLKTEEQFKVLLVLQWNPQAKWLPMPLPLLTSFMDYLFRVRNVSVRTILNYKSATAFYWKSEVGYDVPENDTVVSDLIRRFKRDRPFPTKHVRISTGHQSKNACSSRIVEGHFKANGIVLY